MMQKVRAEFLNNEYECIILAGGFGTRLKSAVPDLPKCMAPINGKPFLQYLIDYLIQQGVRSFIFSLGYLHEFIESFLQENYPTLIYKVVVENEPLGTGGAINLAIEQAHQKNVIVLNGDTMYAVNIQELYDFQTQHNCITTLSLKPMHQFERYGVVSINEQCYIQQFQEKKYYESGLINGGVYALNVELFKKLSLPKVFSFEKDYLEKYFDSYKMMGLIQDKYFIDIGIPEDFEKAKKELS
jgi:D-glycero-alpha-D-manno-heptose 1-phosphate guanylyltransferase